MDYTTLMLTLSVLPAFMIVILLSTQIRDSKLLSLPEVWLVVISNIVIASGVVIAVQYMFINYVYFILILHLINTVVFITRSLDITTNRLNKHISKVHMLYLVLAVGLYISIYYKTYQLFIDI